MDSSQTDNHSTWRSGELPPIMPRYPRGVFRYPDARSTKPFVHEPHNWIVSEHLQVPTHELGKCTTCQVWNDHTRSCTETEHCRVRFERARAGSARNLRLEAYKVLEEKLDESRQRIEELTRLVEERDTRLDDLEIVNAGLMDRLMKSIEAGKQLGDQLCRTFAEMRQIQTQIHNTWSSAAPETLPQPTIPLPDRTAEKWTVINLCGPTSEAQAGCYPGLSTRPDPSPSLASDAQPGFDSGHVPLPPLPSQSLCPDIQPGLNSGRAHSPPLFGNNVHPHHWRSHLRAGPSTIMLYPVKGKEHTMGKLRWKARICRKPT